MYHLLKTFSSPPRASQYPSKGSGASILVLNVESHATDGESIKRLGLVWVTGSLEKDITTVSGDWLVLEKAQDYKREVVGPESSVLPCDLCTELFPIHFSAMLRQSGTLARG